MTSDATSFVPAPLDEDERRRRLAELALLAEPANPSFVKICDLAATLFGVPYAFVSLIDATDAHVFAHHGLGSGQMPRQQAMCDVTVNQGLPLVVPELTMDARFSGSPLVTGEKAMRFYAGVPIEVSPGVRLGALCIADRVGRAVSAAEIAELEGLSALVVEQIEHHARRQRLERLAVQLAGRQAILTQTEHLAQVGGFELEPASGAMLWSDGLCRLLHRGSDPRTHLGDFLACFGDENGRLAAALARLGDRTPLDQAPLDQAPLNRAPLDESALDRPALDMEVPLASGADRRFAHVHAETHVSERGATKIVGIVQDITERKRVVADLEWTAAHDALTGLLNRATFTSAVESAMGRSGTAVALIMVDIDRFKLVNDTLGHDVGDVVLSAATERLRSVVGRRGLVGRIGGDEFGILVIDYRTDVAITELATELLLAMRHPLPHRVGELGTRATLGIALRTREVADATALFKAADLALYSAKEAGRDGFAFFHPTMHAETARKLERLAAARDAVASGTIEPYYQPKILLDSGRLAGFEALLRWAHRDRGLCLPGEIGDAFADPRLATDIGATMLRRVAADMVAWRDAGVAFHHVAINVSEAELCGDDYVGRLLACLDAHGLGAEQVEIEVTESVFLGQASSKAGQKLGDLAAAGFAIALDDFGTGFASLTHLKNYPVSAIKIDRSFVTDIESNRHDAMIVDALTALAHGLGIAVIAEGIETAAQAQNLRRRRCTIGQGFLFAKPMPASRVPHFVRTWNERIARKPLRSVG